MQNEYNNMIFHRILDAFHAREMSVKALSDASGVPYASVHGYINGDRDVITKTASKLARALSLELQPAKSRKRRSG